MSLATASTLRFRPILKEKVWGGRRLDALGKRLPPGLNIGESWEIADLSSTSPTGGGGGEARSVIAGGPLDGHTLHQAIEVWGSLLLGDELLQRERVRQEMGMPAFPLLIKYLDASEHLSVQVHPTPEYAAEHAGAAVKHESWYIVDAEPDAVIYSGLRDGVDESDLRIAIARNQIPEVLRAVPAIPGECHTLPSGTVHALGAGVLVAEVQTSSDTTFRLYDWTEEYDRPARELHLEQAIECARLERPPSPSSREPEAAQSVIAETEFYRIRAVHPHVGESVPLIGAASMGAETPVIVMALPGPPIALLCQGSPPEVLGPGQTRLVPASLAHEASLETEDAPPNALVIDIPQIL